MRLEFGAQTSYFCPKCLKHYPACTSTMNMAMCARLKDHPSLHMDAKGNIWS